MHRKEAVDWGDVPASLYEVRNFTLSARMGIPKEAQQGMQMPCPLPARPTQVLTPPMQNGAEK